MYEVHEQKMNDGAAEIEALSAGIIDLEERQFSKLAQRAVDYSPEAGEILRNVRAGSGMTADQWNVLRPILQRCYDAIISEMRALRSVGWEYSADDHSGKTYDPHSDIGRENLANARGGKKPGLGHQDSK